MNHHKDTAHYSHTGEDALTSQQHSTLGVIIGVSLVILVFMLSGLYLWGATIDSAAGYSHPAPYTGNR